MCMDDDREPDFYEREIERLECLIIRLKDENRELRQQLGLPERVPLPDEVVRDDEPRQMATMTLDMAAGTLTIRPLS